MRVHYGAFSSPMFKTLFVLLALDVALLGGWLLWVRPTSDVAIIEVYAIPLLAVCNALVGAGWWLSKRPRVAGAFFLNMSCPAMR